MYGDLARQQEPQRKSLQEEFEAKNSILGSKFLEIAPSSYLSMIFSDKGDYDDLVVVLGTQKDSQGNIIEQGTVMRLKVGEIWDIAWRSNAYIPYCTFRKNYYHSKTLETVKAFVVDCDGVTSLRLRKVLKYLWSSLPAEPTHIVNSGKGVHFVYVLDKPVKVSGLRWSINRLNRTIQDTFGKTLEVDKHPVVHPYRFPGFMTKINTVATAFRIREPYVFEELMERFKLTPVKRKEKKESSPDMGKIYVMPNGKRAFFEWVLRRLFRNPPIPGRRHNSFFALGIISYKCRREVPYEEAIDAVAMVYDDMIRCNLHIGFTIEEAYSAFHKGYQAKYVRASWKYLSELLGWEYKTNKRNGRSREEHLKYLQKIRQIQKEEKEEHIKRLLAKGYTKSEVAEILGITRQNLYKTYGYLFR